MAIIRKLELNRHIEELNARYNKLKKAIEGNKPNLNISEQYSYNPEDYCRDFVEVDVNDIKYALDDFKTVLTQLKSIKDLKAEKLGTK